MLSKFLNWRCWDGNIKGLKEKNRGPAHGIQGQSVWLCLLDLPLTSPMSLARLPNFTVPQFHICKRREVKSLCHLVWGRHRGVSPYETYKAFGTTPYTWAILGKCCLLLLNVCYMPATGLWGNLSHLIFPTTCKVGISKSTLQIKKLSKLSRLRPLALTCPGIWMQALSSKPWVVPATAQHPLSTLPVMDSYEQTTEQTEITIRLCNQ